VNEKRDEGVLLINQDIYKIFIKNEQNFFFLFFSGRFIFPVGERRRGVGERRRGVGERRRGVGERRRGVRERRRLPPCPPPHL
jgi:hypothetical protein